MRLDDAGRRGEYRLHVCRVGRPGGQPRSELRLAPRAATPLGISAYYSGRAYAPSVVQNPNGTLTMLFAGDRVPKSICYGRRRAGDELECAVHRRVVRPCALPEHPGGDADLVHLARCHDPGGVTSSPADPVAAAAGDLHGDASAFRHPVPGRRRERSVSGSGGAVSHLWGGHVEPRHAGYGHLHDDLFGAQGDTVTATYSGDSNYSSSAASTSVTVAQAPRPADHHRHSDRGTLRW